MNARRSIGGRVRARGGRGRGPWTVLATLVVCLLAGLPGLSLAGIWTQLGSLPVPSTTIVCRTAHGSILVATSPSSPDSSDVWEYDGLTLAKLSSRYTPRPVFGAIHALAEAPSGDVWVGASRGAFRLTASGFTKYTRADGLGSRLVDQVNALVVDSDGTVWAGTEGGGLSSFDGSTWTSYRNPDDGLPSNFVEGLALAADRTLWIAMHNPPSGPALASDKNGVITPSPTSPADLSKIIAASDGRLWAVSPSNGAYVFDASGTLLTQVQAPVISNDLTSVTEGPNGDIWMGSFSNGVYRWNGGAWENFSGAAGLTNPTARDVTTDAAGVLWVATASGLFRYEGALWLAFTPSAFPAMNGGWIISMSRGPVSDFAGPPPARGVTRGPTYVGLSNRPPPLPGGIARISGTTVEAVLDTAGQPVAAPYYVGAIPGGAWAGADKSPTLLRIAGTAVTQAVPTPDGANIKSLLGRPDGTAWAGTTQNLLRFDGSSWSVVNLPGITPATVRSLAADANGGVWVGTDTKGAVHLDGTGVHPITGLPGGAVTGIAVAPNGDTWLGVQTSGVARVSAGNTAVDRLVTTADGLPIGSVQSVGVDQSGRVWVGTTNGLAYLEPGGVAVYNTGDGLQTANVTAMLADTSEALLGSDSNGLALFHRDALAPVVALTDVPASVIATRSARVDFAGGDLSSDNAAIAFSWRLDGIASLPFSTDRTARLANLTDGPHRLEVWSRDRALNVTPQPATLDFEVDATPPQPRLARPAFDEVVRGVTPIVPLVDEPRFLSWKFDYRPAGNEDPATNPWRVVADENLLPPDTLLWDTKPLLDGDYEVRFSVTDTLGLIGYAIVNVTVDNLSPGNQVTSPARIDNNNGGRIFTLNAEVEMYFPPHALDEDRIVTIDTLTAGPAVPPGILPPGASQLVAAWHVTPAGFETKKPVTLTFDERFFAAGGAGTDLAVFAVLGDGSYAYLGGSTDAKHGTLVTTASRLGDFVVARGLFAGLAGSGRALEVEPRAFSPLGSTFDTRAAISFNLQSAEGARVFVYDRAGRLVRRVYDGPLAAGRNVVYWDGRDAHGDPAPSGLYLVAVEVAGKADVRSVAVVNR